LGHHRGISIVGVQVPRAPVKHHPKLWKYIVAKPADNQGHCHQDNYYRTGEDKEK
jgi:hypothetical protein